MEIFAPSKSRLSAVRVLIFGHKEFSQLMSRAVGHYQNEAQFQLYDAIVGSASEVKPYIEKFAPHVIVSAGANAAYLRSVLAIPVVSLQTSNQDWTDALARASKVANSIDVFTFDQANPILPLMAKELNVSVSQHIYKTSDQARELFHTVRLQQSKAVIGASLVCGLANQFNLPSFLVYSEASCHATIQKAIHVGRECQQQSEAKALTHWLLNKSKTPIVLTDTQGSACTLNNAAKDLLELSNTQEFNLSALLGKHPGNAVNSDGECEINGKTWWYHCDQVQLLGNTRYVVQLQTKLANDKKSRYTRTFQNNQSDAIFASAQMREVMAQVNAFSSSPGNVLIQGESGTGKEVVARSLHQQGPYASGQFVAVNCGAIPAELFEGELFGYQDGAYTGSRKGGRKGLIEAARDGVLFLDEVSELQPLQQTKLLRFIQERCYRPLGANQEVHIDVKLVAASNQSLEKMVEQGTFREDLYYRLNVFKINVPALRYRLEDIEQIAQAKLKSLSEEYKVDADLQAALHCLRPYLMSYSWPGNIRELENVVERVIAWLNTVDQPERLANIIHQLVPEFSDTPLHAAEQSHSIQTQESQLILQAMQQLNGDRRKVAAYLGISPTTLWRRLKKLNYKN